MSYTLKQQSNRLDYNYREYTVDNEADIQDIPVNTCIPGSVCFVINGSRVFMLNNEKEWEEI